MVLRAADAERWTNQHVVRRELLGFTRYDFRAERVCADEPVGAVLFHRTDRDHDCPGCLQPCFDVGPGRNGKQHTISPFEARSFG